MVEVKVHVEGLLPPGDRLRVESSRLLWKLVLPNMSNESA